MTQIPGYNPNEVEAQTSFEALPAGDYVMLATAGEIKQTKAGTGSYVMLTNEVMEGEFKGRKVWSRFNVVNPNEQAVTIGRAQLKQLAEAINNADANDIQGFLDKPFTASVTYKDDPKYGPSNDIKKYAPYVAGAQQATTTAPAQAASSDKPSWA